MWKKTFPSNHKLPPPNHFVWTKRYLWKFMRPSDNMRQVFNENEMQSAWEKILYCLNVNIQKSKCIYHYHDEADSTSNKTSVR